MKMKRTLNVSIMSLGICYTVDINHLVCIFANHDTNISAGTDMDFGDIDFSVSSSRDIIASKVYFRLYLCRSFNLTPLLLFSQKLNMGGGPSDFDADVPEGKSALVTQQQSIPYFQLQIFCSPFDLSVVNCVLFLSFVSSHCFCRRR